MGSLFKDTWPNVTPRNTYSLPLWWAPSMCVSYTPFWLTISRRCSHNISSSSNVTWFNDYQPHNDCMGRSLSIWQTLLVVPFSLEEHKPKILAQHFLNKYYISQHPFWYGHGLNSGQRKVVCENSESALKWKKCAIFTLVAWHAYTIAKHGQPCWACHGSCKLKVEENQERSSLGPEHHRVPCQPWT